MDEREYRRRIRRNRIAQEEKKRIRQQLRQTMVVCALACVMLLVCCLWSAEPTYAKTNAATASGSCAVLMRWPLNGAQVVGKYDAPKQQWLPGHRGCRPACGPSGSHRRARGRRDRLQRQRGRQSRGHHPSWRRPFRPDLDVRTRHCGTRCRRTCCARGAFRACGGRIRPLRRAVPALGDKIGRTAIHQSGKQNPYGENRIERPVKQGSTEPLILSIRRGLVEKSEALRL